MGYGMGARRVAEAAPEWTPLPGDVVFDQLWDIMKEVLPESGQCMVFNKGRGHRQKNISVADLIRCRTPYLTVVHPKGNDGSADHAVCVVDDFIFDARFSHALKLCDDTFKWVYGPKDVCQLGHVLRFCLPHGVKKTKHERVMRHNLAVGASVRDSQVLHALLIIYQKKKVYTNSFAHCLHYASFDE
jgi:hypothetical protein